MLFFQTLTYDQNLHVVLIQLRDTNKYGTGDDHGKILTDAGQFMFKVLGYHVERQKYRKINENFKYGKLPAVIDHIVNFTVVDDLDVVCPHAADLGCPDSDFFHKSLEAANLHDLTGLEGSFENDPKTGQRIGYQILRTYSEGWSWS